MDAFAKGVRDVLPGNPKAPGREGSNDVGNPLLGQVEDHVDVERAPYAPEGARRDSAHDHIADSEGREEGTCLLHDGREDLIVPTGGFGGAIR